MDAHRTKLAGRAIVNVLRNRIYVVDYSDLLTVVFGSALNKSPWNTDDEHMGTDTT